MQILEVKKCANPECKQEFKIWEREARPEHYCSEYCFGIVRGAKSFWGAEDRRATEIKNLKAKKGSKK